MGLPLPGVEAAIDDADGDGSRASCSSAGPRCAGATGAATTPADGGRWFATGDLVSVADDGYVTIRGRRTELIITGGHNVYPAEVEAVLARHPVCRGRRGRDAVGGMGRDRRWPSSSGDPDLDVARGLADRELAPFKRPRQVHLVDELPRNALGKVVRRDLRDPPEVAASRARGRGSVMPCRRS